MVGEHAPGSGVKRKATGSELVLQGRSRRFHALERTREQEAQVVVVRSSRQRLGEVGQRAVRSTRQQLLAALLPVEQAEGRLRLLLPLVDHEVGDEGDRQDEEQDADGPDHQEAPSCRALSLTDGLFAKQLCLAPAA